ncbi:MAG TPA: histidine kinase [Lachnospiraceae bacterium]|nr:histidine kinase [Lachnospiraceae bacterium]
MSEIIDKILLLLLTSSYTLLFSYSKYSILSILIAIFLVCLSTCFSNKRFRFGIYFIFLVSSAFVPAAFYFLPLILYDLFSDGLETTILFAFIPYLIHYEFYSNYSLALFGLFIAISLNLKLRAKKEESLTQEYYKLRDDTKEMEMILEKQNQTLLENQDFEITNAMLSERNRISKEIHDNIGHLLSRSLLQIGALLTITKEDITRETLTSLRDSISDGMDSVRNSIHNMHDESIDLYNSINTLVNEFTFCHINFEYDMQTQPDIKIKNCFISTVKEALNNIIKHSNATSVTVKLNEHPGLYQLIIMDNGKLTSTAKWYISQNKTGDGMGLQSMADRVNGFHGNFNINTDSGFQIFITVPKA